MNQESQKRIYLDYAATTPIDHRVLEAMMPYLHGRFGNPSSIHLWGQEAQIAIDEARKKVADFLGCETKEIIFTGSATEADNLAIKGVIRALKSKFQNPNVKSNPKSPPKMGEARPTKLGGKIQNFKPHIITSAIEHKAVLEPCYWLEKIGLVGVTYLPVDKEGIVRVSDVEKAIKQNTVLISIMYANNEIGTVQPIREIGDLIKKINESMVKISNFQFPISNKIPNSKFQTPNSRIFFHTDAVQAVNYLDCDIDQLGVDLLTMSGHKIYGPKGVGALYIRRGTPIEPLIHGGGQENDMRAGTENVAAIVGLGAAIAEIQKPKSKNQNPRIKKLRDKLIDGILKKIPGTRLNGSRTKRLPNNVNISFEGAEGEAIVIALDQQGVGVSTGSACAAKALTPSHVIMALTRSEEVAHSSVRFSLGRYTTEKEINYVLKVLPGIIERLRKISGYKILKSK